MKLNLQQIAIMTREQFDNSRDVGLVGNYAATRFVNEVVRLIKHNPLYGTTNLYDVVQNEAKHGVTA